jgi:RimJ/RimL family protein N-acetyltransferase
MKLSFYKITENDLSFVNETRNGYAAEFLHDSRIFTLQEITEWYNKTNPNYWIIFDSDINERVGYFRLSNHSVINKNIYIGADISQKFKNKGYGTEAYKKFIPLLFGFYDLHKISLEVLETNNLAIHLYEKLGFVREGVKRQEVYKNGNWINSIIMSIIK